MPKMIRLPLKSVRVNQFHGLFSYYIARRSTQIVTHGTDSGVSSQAVIWILSHDDAMCIYAFEPKCSSDYITFQIVVIFWLVLME